MISYSAALAALRESLDEPSGATVLIAHNLVAVPRVVLNALDGKP